MPRRMASSYVIAQALHHCRLVPTGTSLAVPSCGRGALVATVSPTGRDKRGPSRYWHALGSSLGIPTPKAPRHRQAIGSVRKPPSAGHCRAARPARKLLAPRHWQGPGLEIGSCQTVLQCAPCARTQGREMPCHRPVLRTNLSTQQKGQQKAQSIGQKLFSTFFPNPLARAHEM